MVGMSQAINTLRKNFEQALKHREEAEKTLAQISKAIVSLINPK